MIYLDEILQGVKTVGITGHIRPDGDCVGSTLVLLYHGYKLLQIGDLLIVQQEMLLKIEMIKKKFLKFSRKFYRQDAFW